MKEELAALKKKFDAGKLTKFKYNKGVRDIKKNYGKAAPSNVTKIVDFISRKVGPAMTEKGGAKGAAARKKAAEQKAAEQTARSDRQLIKKAKTVKKRAAPKFNPSGLKMSTESMEKALLAKSDNIKTPPSKRDGKGKLSPKSSAKTWRDVKSVSAAKDAKLNYFTGRDGKKKVAITAEQLKKKGMSLTAYANSLKGKK